jgi:YhcH/YjgK/YiaL family protein
MAFTGKIDELLSGIREEKLAEGLKYLRALSPDFMAQKGVGFVGRVEIDGDNLFALHQVYTTSPESAARFEGHKKYIDLQYILSGEERILLTRLDDLSPSIPYDEEKDIAFYKPQQWGEIVLEAGMVAVFYPKDLHAPGLSPASGPSTVRKTVVKVRV